MRRSKTGFIVWILIYMIVFIWSAVEPKDFFTWVLEVLPAMIGAVLMALTYKSFRLTPMLYILILVHMIILMVGGHYTYAEVPLFDRLSEIMGWSRNNFDKLGHFMQGFEPAILAREILIRNHAVNGKGWLNLFILSICLGFSALYELIEWQVALWSKEAADSFLGTQGYVWDTQSDMGYALVGAITALLLLSRWHDRQLRDMGV
jgi:putative membrane protein